jgi:hypothetical protein
MFKRSAALLLCLFLSASSIYAQQTVLAPQTTPAQQDSSLKPKTFYVPRVVRDSAFFARQRIVTDSIMTHTWILPDSLLDKTMIMDSIMRVNVYGRPKNEPWYVLHGKKKVESIYRVGKPVPKGELWVIGFILLMLIMFAILNIL